MHAWKVQTNLMYLESTAGYFAAVFIASKYTTFTLQKQTGCLATVATKWRDSGRVVYFAELFCSYIWVWLCFKTTGICLDIVLSYTSNSCECMGVNGEALQLHAVYREPYFLLQVTRESVSVLQVCLVSWVEDFLPRHVEFLISEIDTRFCCCTCMWCILIRSVPNTSQMLENNRSEPDRQFLNQWTHSGYYIVVWLTNYTCMYILM